MPDEPELRALRALIERNHADTREDFVDLKAQIGRDFAAIGSRLDSFLPREVFEAREATRQVQHDALLVRVADLETDQKASKNAVRAAVYTAIAAVASSVAVGVLVPILSRGK